MVFILEFKRRRSLRGSRKLYSFSNCTASANRLELTIRIRCSWMVISSIGAWLPSAAPTASLMDTSSAAAAMFFYYCTFRRNSCFGGAAFRYGANWAWIAINFDDKKLIRLLSLMPYLVRQQDFNTNWNTEAKANAWFHYYSKVPTPHFNFHQTFRISKHPDLLSSVGWQRDGFCAALSLEDQCAQRRQSGHLEAFICQNLVPSEGNCYRLGVCDNWIVLRDGSRPKAVIFDDSIFPTARQPTLHDSSFKVEIGCGASSSKLGNARAVAT